MSRKKKHKAHHEMHISEAWLIPYADILTLLLALFIVLYSTAQVDQKKFEQLAYSFSVAFNGSPTILDSIKTNQQMTDGAPSSPTTTPASDPSLKEKAYAQETTQLTQSKAVLDKYIMENNLTGDLQTVMTEDGLVIRIRDTALFPSGSADIASGARRFGTEIAKMLVPLNQKIIISGHTDNIPINTSEFPSNWDLSAKRAVNFMKFLLSQQEKLQPNRFSAVGYGEFRPIAPNSVEDGRGKNRRVEVLVARNFKM